MKFQMTLKDPSGPEDSIQEAAKQSVMSFAADFSAAEIMAAIEQRESRLSNFASKWLKWGEYVTIEFDTEAGTATVLEAQ